MIGFINVYKPSNVTSNYVVQKIKHKFNIKKIGHMGTLDPMAKGILPIAVGKATRLFDYSLEKTKRYIATFKFGLDTDTLDVTGQTISSVHSIPNEEDIIKIIPRMIGDIDQVPPNFSAKNINGTKAYKLARLGETFELKPKKITIHSISLLKQISSDEFQFDILCSSGTYIRSIARDMAELLGTKACMSDLERIKTGVFDISSSITLDKLLLNNNLNEFIISPIDVFKDFDVINITKDEQKQLVDGKIVECKQEIYKTSFVVCNENIIGITKPNKNKIKLDTFLLE